MIKNALVMLKLLLWMMITYDTQFASELSGKGTWAFTHHKTCCKEASCTVQIQMVRHERANFSQHFLFSEYGIGAYEWHYG